MTQPRPLRAAVVGAGLMGRWHADAVARAGGVVASVCDGRPERAASLAARYRGARTALDVESVLRDDSVQVVHVCTPLETHETIAAAALGAGRHVLVEKPMTRTAAAAADLLRLAESRGLLLAPVHQFLFQPGVLRAQAILPTLGDLLHLDTVACSAGAAELGEEGQDRIVAEILPHPLALVARLVPVPIGDVRWAIHHPRAGELRCVGDGHGVSISLLVSMHGRPTSNALRLVATRGTIHVDLFHGFVVIEPSATSRAHKVVHPFLLAGGTALAATSNLLARALRVEQAYPGLRELVRRFYLAVRREAPPPIAASEALAVMHAWEGIAKGLG